MAILRIHLQNDKNQPHTRHCTVFLLSRNPFYNFREIKIWPKLHTLYAVLSSIGLQREALRARPDIVKYTRIGAIGPIEVRKPYRNVTSNLCLP